MVIEFRGTQKSKNNAPYALAVCATMSAIRYGNKTVVIQFTSKYPIENVLLGKELAAGYIKSHTFEDTGIDALLRRTDTRKITTETWGNAAQKMIKTENGFDVIRVSDKTNLTHELSNRAEEISYLFEEAKKVYEQIFILADGKDKELLELLEPEVDVSVITVSQGNKEEIINPGKNPIYIIADFDKNSVYNKKYLEKIYGVKHMYTMPYSTEFKDAYNGGTVLQYTIKNDKSSEGSVNYQFINDMAYITEIILGDDIREEKDLEFPRLRARKIKPAVIENEISPEHIKSKTITKGRFFKKTKNIKVIETEDSDDTVENTTVITKDEKPKKKKISWFKKKEKVKVPDFEEEYDDDSPIMDEE